MKEDGVMGCSIYYNAQKFECLDRVRASRWKIEKRKELTDASRVSGRGPHVAEAPPETAPSA